MIEINTHFFSAIAFIIAMGIVIYKFFPQVITILNAKIAAIKEDIDNSNYDLEQAVKALKDKKDELNNVEKFFNNDIKHLRNQYNNSYEKENLQLKSQLKNEQQTFHKYLNLSRDKYITAQLISLFDTTSDHLIKKHPTIQDTQSQKKFLSNSLKEIQQFINQ